MSKTKTYVIVYDSNRDAYSATRLRLEVNETMLSNWIARLQTQGKVIVEVRQTS